VALRRPDPESDISVIDPVGATTFRQKVVPLNFRVDKFGEATPTGGAVQYDLTGVTVAGVALTAAQRATVQDMFARPQFRKMADHEKLSVAAYEPLDSGVFFAQLNHRGAPIDRGVEYETIIVDSLEGWQAEQPTGAHKGAAYRLLRDRQLSMVAAGAQTRATLRNSGAMRFAPDSRATQFTLDDEHYLVLDSETLRPAKAILRDATSHGRARDALDDYIRAHPDARGNFHVAPVHEQVA
jgi:hypothetical protein